MNNREIRKQAKNKGVRLWEIAEMLGITDSTFSKKLRRELPQEEQDIILAISKEKRRWKNN